TSSFAAVAGRPVVPGTASSRVLSGGLAVSIDRAVFRRLRAISPEGKMIVSWGVALFIRSIVAAVFGGASRNFPTEAAPLELAGAQVTSLDLIVVAATLVAMVVLRFLLYRTRIGTALRALA